MGDKGHTLHLERRTVLSLGGLTLVVVCASRVYFANRWSVSSTESDLLRQFGRELYQEFDITDLSRSYLNQFPAEANADDLTKLILGSSRSVNRGGGMRNGNLEELKILLGRRVRQDFEKADVVILDGWALSKTEARILVLASLG